VEITAAAPHEVLQHFIDWCKQGPPRARVDEVFVEERELEEFEGFKILR
jgi:acylphosphatase